MIYKILATLLFCFFSMSVLLTACEKEMSHEELKHLQWQHERENNLPYTSYRGE